MLIAVTLLLSPETDLTLPGHLGRAAYAATLNRIEQFDPALAKAIHDGDGPKPLTCSSILNVRSGQPALSLRRGERYPVRITGLHPAVSTVLHAALVEQPPQTWTLDRRTLRVAATVCDPTEDPWSGITSYEELAAGELRRRGPAERTVRLQFASPTAFKSNGITVPVPLPGLVFGSLVERWNAFSPITLDPTMRQFGEEAVAISQYRLQSVALAQKNEALRIGGEGDVTYRVLADDAYGAAVVQMLAAFARFSGVGVQTATGMGQVRKLARQAGA